MKTSQDANFSISGDKSQALSLYKKIGIGLFLAGIICLTQAYQSKKDTQYLFSMLAFAGMLSGSFFFTYRNGNLFKDRLFSKTASGVQWLALLFSLFGFGILLFAWAGIAFFPATQSLVISFSSMVIGIGLTSYALYGTSGAGIKNDGVWTSSLTGRGMAGWAFGLLLSYFYIVLYWGKDPFPMLISLFDSLSMVFRGKSADKWFVYGLSLIHI